MGEAVPHVFSFVRRQGAWFLVRDSIIPLAELHRRAAGHPVAPDVRGLLLEQTLRPSPRLALRARFRSRRSCWERLIDGAQLVPRKGEIVQRRYAVIDLRNPARPD